MSEVDTLTLRPKQNDMVHVVHNEWRAGRRKVLCVAPTGAGKRYIACWWAQRAQAKEHDTLIVTDRRILVGQMYEELHRFGIDYGVIMGEHLENRQPFIQVASIHAIRKRYFDKPDQLPPARFIIIDEAHKELDAYRVLLSHYPDAYVAALTATPVGPQGKPMRPLYDAFVEGMFNSELIAEQLLLPTRVFSPSEPNIKGVNVVGGKEYPQELLSAHVQAVTCFADLFTEWMPFADRKTIVFAPGVKYCYGLAGGPEVRGDSFYARGIRAEVIEANTKQADRTRIFEEFNDPASALKVLVSVDVLKEGFDAPIASCGIDLQPNAQLRTYWQKIGRIKRTYPEQDEAIWIDMAGNSWKFPHPDDDPPWQDLSDEETTQDMIQRQRDAGKPPLIRCPKCKAQRQSGKRCPECGYESEPSQSTRTIRMGKGKLKEVSALHIKAHAKTEHEKVADKWKSVLFAALHSGKTLAQCRGMYRHKHGDWPPNNLPCMPKRYSADWKSRVADIYPKGEIVKQFYRKAE